MALAASPFGVMLSSPLAGRLAAFIAPKRLALSGTAAMAVAQVVIGTTGGDVNLPLLLGAMFLQGVGLGLFQVAYFDIATATIPKEDRGVAGSLVMMTRTVGVVTGATVLMLVFQSLRSAAIAQGTPDADAFLVGFQGAFRIAAALPVIVLLACLARGWARR
jgi:MFS family permease